MKLKYIRAISFFITLSCSIMIANPVFASASNSNPSPDSQAVISINRLFGQTRYGTAIAIANRHYRDKIQNIILATGNDYADALSASVLAHERDAPILLVDTSADNLQETLDYISQHLIPTGTVYIAGGSSVISNDFESRLNNLGFNNIVRISGSDRYETSFLAARLLNRSSVSTAVISSGEQYSDALSISSYAANKGWPILLTPQDTLPQKVKEFLWEKKPSQVYITGGTGVISGDIESEIGRLLPQTNIVRLAGQSCYDTNIIMAKAFSSKPFSLFIATNNDFADALTGSVLASISGDPIILVDASNPALPDSVADYLRDLHILGLKPNLFVLGGNEVIPDEKVKDIRNLILGIDTEKFKKLNFDFSAKTHVVS